MRSEFTQTRYLFHIHTDFTDGESTVADYFAYASSHGWESLIFLEHIRREPSYDVDKLAFQIRKCAKEFGLSAVLGFEAKVLPDGSLDIAEEHLELAQVIGMAEHGFFGDLNQKLNALWMAIDVYGRLTPRKRIVWVHPGLWLKKQEPSVLNLEPYLELLSFAVNKGLKLEKNMKYGLLPSEVLVPFSANVITGWDAHRVNDLETARSNEL